ncbi:MAG: helix-turn-helix domain-containing protein [Bacteroidales bacterium]|jgi:transcriptional regulator with XRE-family HTH domain|nr:helix-turn-helix domain-containing protein [Bacteroidales bacterium]
MDWTSLSNHAILQEIGKRIKDYRLKRRLTRQELALQAGVSISTLSQIEKGNAVSISMLLPILRVLRLLDNLELLLPEIGISPVEMLKLKGKQPRRVRNKKTTKS